MEYVAKTNRIGSVKRNSLAKLWSLIHFRHILKESKQAKRNLITKPKYNLAFTNGDNSDVSRSSSFETIAESSSFLCQYSLETDSQGSTSTDMSICQEVYSLPQNGREKKEDAQANSIIKVCSSKMNDASGSIHFDSLKEADYSCFKTKFTGSFKSLQNQAARSYSDFESHSAISNCFLSCDAVSNCDCQTILLTPYECALFASEDPPIYSSFANLDDSKKRTEFKNKSKSIDSIVSNTFDSYIENCGTERITIQKTNTQTVTGTTSQKFLVELSIFTPHEIENVFAFTLSLMVKNETNSRELQHSCELSIGKNCQQDGLNEESKILDGELREHSMVTMCQIPLACLQRKYNTKFNGSITKRSDEVTAGNLNRTLSRNEDVFKNIEIGLFGNVEAGITCTKPSGEDEITNAKLMYNSEMNKLSTNTSTYSYTQKNLVDGNYYRQTPYDLLCMSRSPLEIENLSLTVSSPSANNSDKIEVRKSVSDLSCGNKFHRRQGVDYFKLGTPLLTLRDVNDRTDNFGYNSSNVEEKRHVPLICESKSRIPQMIEKEPARKKSGRENEKSVFKIEYHPHRESSPFQNCNYSVRNPNLKTKSSQKLKRRFKSSRSYKNLTIRKKSKAVLAIMDMLLSRMEGKGFTVSVFDTQR